MLIKKYWKIDSQRQMRETKGNWFGENLIFGMSGKSSKIDIWRAIYSWGFVLFIPGNFTEKEIKKTFQNVLKCSEKILH